ncbi:hypothetical protein ACFRAM_18430 [Paenibacillus sp. NPDC056722]|uniref:hypothetical protein n=1 Tax=Paenibacillus sp. NPDC056722 TaxID=3345924 RepID=UPI003696577B
MSDILLIAGPFLNIVIDEYLALAWCDSGGGDDGGDGGDGCDEYPGGNHRCENRDGDVVYVHGRNVVAGDLFAEILELHCFLVAWMYSFRFLNTA